MIIKMDLGMSWKKGARQLTTITEYTYPISIQERLDEVLDSGQFIMYSEEINKINPFTYCEITDNNGYTTKWFANGTADMYVVSKGYKINVTLIELTKITEKIIIGSKSFTQHTISDAFNSNAVLFNHISNIVEYEYGIKLVFNSQDEIYNEAHRDYTFSSGTTLSDVLFQIGKSSNAIPYVEDVYFDGKPTLSIRFLDFDAPQESIEVDLKDIMNISFSNNLDDITDSMVTEVSNVSDMNTPTTAVSVAFTSKDIQINNDNVLLMLPTPVFKVNRICVRGDRDPQVFIKFYINQTNIVLYQMENKSYTLNNILNNIYGANEELNNVYESIRRYINLVGETENGNKVINGYFKVQLDDVTQEIDGIESTVGQYVYLVCDDTFSRVKKHNDNSTTYTASDYGDYISLKDLKVGVTYYDISRLLVSYEEYNLMGEEEKEHIIYYQNGSNEINGWTYYYNYMYGIDKATPLYEYLPKAVSKFPIYSPNDDYSAIEYMEEMPNGTALYVMAGAKPSKEFINFKFYVEYIPLLNTKVKVNKVENPLLSRSYDNGGETIDADAMAVGISNALNRSGNDDITLEMEYRSDFNVGKRITITKDNDILRIKSYDTIIDIKDYIITSLDITNNLGKCPVALMTIAKDYRVNELIGIPSQYTATSIPNANIIDRYIYHEIEVLEESRQTIMELQHFLYVTDKGNVLVPINKLVTDKYIQCVVEFQDNYSVGFDKNKESILGAIKGGGRAYVRSDIPYVDNYGETSIPTEDGTWVQYALMKDDKNITNGDFPFYDGNLQNIVIKLKNGNNWGATFTASKNTGVFSSGIKAHPIEKDGRERIIFVFQFNF